MALQRVQNIFSLSVGREHNRVDKRHRSHRRRHTLKESCDPFVAQHHGRGGQGIWIRRRRDLHAHFDRVERVPNQGDGNTSSSARHKILEGRYFSRGGRAPKVLYFFPTSRPPWHVREETPRSCCVPLGDEVGRDTRHWGSAVVQTQQLCKRQVVWWPLSFAGTVVTEHKHGFHLVPIGWQACLQQPALDLLSLQLAHMGYLELFSECHKACVHVEELSKPQHMVAACVSGSENAHGFLRREIFGELQEPLVQVLAADQPVFVCIKAVKHVPAPLKYTHVLFVPPQRRRRTISPFEWCRR
mmetsp:Transcript_11149/g.21182  ORF Transcript_11149/g.21182 Transcript_11149/m.21182 type:complete len:300 (-) Transcript_11149:49-948(-)